MRGDWAGLENLSLRVDGAYVLIRPCSDWRDICQCQVQRPVSLETTALGAAYLAGLQAGVMPSPSERVALWQASASFEVKSDQSVADADYARWRYAVQRNSEHRNSGPWLGAMTAELDIQFDGQVLDVDASDQDEAVVYPAQQCTRFLGSLIAFMDDLGRWRAHGRLFAWIWR